jgi:hypothetical protein
VISTISSQPPMIADELRRQADVFTDLAELRSKLSRDPSERPTRAASSGAAGFASRDPMPPRVGDSESAD